MTYDSDGEPPELKAQYAIILQRIAERGGAFEFVKAPSSASVHDIITLRRNGLIDVMPGNGVNGATLVMLTLIGAYHLKRARGVEIDVAQKVQSI